MSDCDYRCNDQCDGGSLCIHGLCQCPKGYSWTSQQKYAKDGAESVSLINIVTFENNESIAFDNIMTYIYIYKANCTDILYM